MNPPLRLNPVKVESIVESEEEEGEQVDKKTHLYEHSRIY